MYSLHAMADQRDPRLDPSTVDAVLFDLDGTLMDTDDQMVENLALRLQRLGSPRLYRNARRLVMIAETPANALMTALDAVGLDTPLLGIWSRLRNLRRDGEKPSYRMMEDADRMLADLKHRYSLAVVTTRRREAAEAFLAQHSLCDVFDVVVTREDTLRLKPHPAPIRHTAELLGVPVERCVMVGDTVVDVKSARRAGAKAVAVTCGFGERAELERAKPAAVLEHVSALSSIL